MGKKVSDCALDESVQNSVNDSIRKVADDMKKGRSRFSVILDEEDPVGILTASDIIYKVVALGKSAEEVKAKDIMTSPVFILDENEDLNTAFVAMVKKALNYCPVVGDEGFAGSLTLIELIACLGDPHVH